MDISVYALWVDGVEVERYADYQRCEDACIERARNGKQDYRKVELVVIRFRSHRVWFRT